MSKKDLITILITLFCGVLYYYYVSTPTFEPITIESVIDGDTITIENGASIRLIGINTPEKNMPLSTEATAFTKQFIDGKAATLDNRGTDRYGRILGYVYLNNRLLQEALVREGYAHLYYYDKDENYNLIAQAEKEAQREKKGIWQESPYTSCITLIEFDYYDINDENETISLENTCNTSIPVILKDDATHIFKETLNPGIFTKHLKNTFNDDGDTLYLWDEEGRLILFYRYT